MMGRKQNRDRDLELRISGEEDRGDFEAFELDTLPPEHFDERPRQLKKETSAMNKKLTVVLLGCFFLGMAFLLVSQITTKPQEHVDTAAGKEDQVRQPERFSVKMSVGQPTEQPEAQEKATAPELPAKTIAMTPPEPEQPPVAEAFPPTPGLKGGAATEAPAEQDLPAATAAPSLPSPAASPEPEPSAAAVGSSQAKAESLAAESTSPPQPAEEKPAASKTAPSASRASGPPAATKESENRRLLVNSIKAIRVSATADSATIVITTARPIDAYQAFTLKGPARVVVDMQGKWRGYKEATGVSPGSLLKAVRVGMHPDKIRIAGDLSVDTQKSVSATKKSATELVVTIR